jgi:hypothetical protein
MHDTNDTKKAAAEAYWQSHGARLGSGRRARDGERCCLQSKEDDEPLTGYAVKMAAYGPWR